MSAPTTYSGGLQAKRKNELQQLASSLNIDQGGTKEDLVSRIKDYLDKNRERLEGEERFGGLFPRRRGRPPSSRFVPLSEPTSSAEPTSDAEQQHRQYQFKIQTPANAKTSTATDSPFQVSSMLQNPFSPNPRPASIDAGVIPTPPATDKRDEESREENSEGREVAVRSENGDGERANGEAVEEVGPTRSNTAVLLEKVGNGVIYTRWLLSSARNLYILTTFLELVYILYTTVPWISTTIQSTDYTVRYPKFAHLITPRFYRPLLNWSIPSLIIPLIIGLFVSFQPSTFVFRNAPAQPERPSPSEPAEQDKESEHSQNSQALVRRTTACAQSRSSLVREGTYRSALYRDDPIDFSAPPLPPPRALSFDPLSATIVKLALHVIWPFPGRTDVLGFKLRIVEASVGVAFAFAEAIGKGGMFY